MNLNSQSILKDEIKKQIKKNTKNHPHQLIKPMTQVMR